jgi:hypothetical protein
MNLRFSLISLQISRIGRAAGRISGDLELARQIRRACRGFFFLGRESPDLAADLGDLRPNEKQRPLDLADARRIGRTCGDRLKNLCRSLEIGAKPADLPPIF